MWIRNGNKINPMDNESLCGCETEESSKSDESNSGNGKVIAVIVVIVIITALLILLAAVLYKFRAQIQKKLKLPPSNLV